MYTNSLLASLNARKTLEKLINESSGDPGTISVSLRDVPNNGQVNLIHTSQVFMSSGFYYKNSSVELYLLKLVPLGKNSILVMTKTFMMQVQRKSRRSAVFTFDFVITKFLYIFLISRWTIPRSYPVTRKDAHLVLLINTIKSHSYAGIQLSLEEQLECCNIICLCLLTS